MRRLFAAVVIAMMSCVEGPVGPMGPIGADGEKGDSASVYQKVGLFTIQDVAGCRYKTDEGLWKIESYYCSTIKNVDSCIVQVLLRRDSTTIWFEPDWGYGYTYREMWQVWIPDETAKYIGYQGKIVIIGK